MYSILNLKQLLKYYELVKILDLISKTTYVHKMSKSVFFNLYYCTTQFNETLELIQH